MKAAQVTQAPLFFLDNISSSRISHPALCLLCGVRPRSAVIPFPARAISTITPLLLPVTVLVSCCPLSCPALPCPPSPPAPRRPRTARLCAANGQIAGAGSCLAACLRGSTGHMGVEVEARPSLVFFRCAFIHFHPSLLCRHLIARAHFEHPPTHNRSATAAAAAAQRSASRTASPTPAPRLQAHHQQASLPCPLCALIALYRVAGQLPLRNPIHFLRA